MRNFILNGATVEVATRTVSFEAIAQLAGCGPGAPRVTYRFTEGDVGGDLHPGDVLGVSHDLTVDARAAG